MEYKFNPAALKRAMLECKMSEASLAQTIGVSRACINRILKQTRSPSGRVIVGLKTAFPDKPLDYFFTEDPDRQN
ncbi:MAG: helix-turn-helix transcriptional regulator [Bacillota bacterium]|nr:helix-turn-helix transcriptional regulator [Bacillota bacterium]